MPLTEARRRANDKYIAKAYDRVELKLYKGQKDIVKQYAERQGMSLNAYINSLIKSDMGDELTIPEKEKKD